MQGYCIRLDPYPAAGNPNPIYPRIHGYGYWRVGVQIQAVVTVDIPLLLPMHWYGSIGMGAMPSRASELGVSRALTRLLTLWCAESRQKQVRDISMNRCIRERGTGYITDVHTVG